jgi:hypothetical protein
MDVRLARPTDAPLIMSVALDDGAHLVRTPSWPANNHTARTLARSFGALSLHGRMWIVREGSSLALIEIEPRRYVIGWDVTRLAVRGDPDRVLGPALHAAVDHLQSKGVPRLFARCSSEAGDILRQHDFQQMAREFVFVGPSQPSCEGGDLSIDARYRIPADAWPLHQLEMSVTPPMIRQLEGLTSVEWSKRIKDMTEVVVERDGKLVAWVGWGPAAGPHFVQVNLLVEPAYADLAPELVRHAVQQLKAGDRPVARVRDYHNEAIRAVLENGFELVAEEVLMLKHAGVERALASRRRLQVAPVPSLQALNVRLGSPRRMAASLLPRIPHGRNLACDRHA